MEATTSEDGGLLGFGTLHLGGSEVPVAAVLIGWALLVCALCALVGCACCLCRRHRRSAAATPQHAAGLPTRPTLPAAKGSSRYLNLGDSAEAGRAVELPRPRPTVVHGALTRSVEVGVKCRTGVAPPPPSSAPTDDVTLPPGWEKAYTDDGNPFFHNRETGETQWGPPPMPTARETLHIASEELATAGTSVNEMSAGAGYLKAYRNTMKGQLSSTRPKG